MKKLISLLLLVCLIFGLIACTNGADPSPEGSIGSADRFWNGDASDKPGSDSLPDTSPADTPSPDNSEPSGGDGKK